MCKYKISSVILQPKSASVPFLSAATISDWTPTSISLQSFPMFRFSSCKIRGERDEAILFPKRVSYTEVGSRYREKKTEKLNL